MAKGSRRKSKGSKKRSAASSRWLRDATPKESRQPNEHLLAALHAAADQHLDRTGVTLTQRDEMESIAFGLDTAGHPLVYVFAHEAALRNGTVRIAGDSLGPGEHWGQLRDLLVLLQAGQPPVSGISLPPEVLTTFPEWFPDELRTAAMRASARIRTRRQRGLAHQAVLKADALEVRFDPVRASLGGHVVPFRVADAHASPFDGVLVLEGDGDPISMRFDAGEGGPDAHRAWALALVGFADLTCVDESTEARRGGVRQRGERAMTPRSGDRTPTLPTRTRTHGRAHSLSSTLTPSGETAKYASSWVAGHRRLLRPGQHCGEEARAGARAHGIELGSGETWVRPHPRGIPEGFVLRFDWRPPAEFGVHAAQPAAA